jgi:hypothetical protein
MASFGRILAIGLLLVFGALSTLIVQANSAAQQTATPTATVTSTAAPTQEAAATTEATAAAESALTITSGVPMIVQLVGGAGPIDLLFTATVGQTITVTARSEIAGAIDTTLQVLSADNENLAFNDDHETRSEDLSSRDSVIEDFELPEEGIYIIRVDSFTGASSGNVEVTLDASGGRSVDGSGTIVVEDRLRSNRTFETTFEGNEGDVVTITVRDLPNDDIDIDPLVTLLDEDGEVLAENDDHENRDQSLDLFDARIENFVLPASGTYTIAVDEFFGDAGEFELSVQFGTTVSNPSNDEAVSIEPIEVEGTVPANSTFEQPLEVNAGAVVTITVRSDLNGELDPILQLLDPNGDIAAENDDHNADDDTLSRYDAQIAQFEIPTSGTYIIVVSGYAASSGDFTLTIVFEN